MSAAKKKVEQSYKEVKNRCRPVNKKGPSPEVGKLRKGKKVKCWR